MKKSAPLTSVLLCGTACLLAQPAHAQSSSDNDDTQITVTAQRFVSSLDLTPLAISVLGGDDLEAENIDSSTDLQLHVPGLVLSTNIIQGQTYIRGIGSEISSIAADPSVAFIVDGVYFPRLSTALQDLYDVKRVEVVKGPQGTLYGRNATGGVISIVSNRPTHEFEGSADILYGSYDQQRYRGTINAPLGQEVAVRLTGMRRSRDGYAVNPLTGKPIDNVDDWAFRMQTLFGSTGPAELVLSGDFSRSRGAPHAAVHIISATAPAISAGGTVNADPYKINQNFQNEVDNDQSGLSANLKWKLGAVELASITAYRETDFRLLLDLDGTEANWFVHDPDLQHSETFSQEFQLAHQGGAFDWVAGLYYFSEKADSSYNLALPLAGLKVSVNATNQTDAYAAFAQGTYSLTQQLRLTAGIRYSDETKETTVARFVNGTKVGTFAGKKSWDAFTPKFSVEFHPSDRTMLYVSATRGFKSGGFNSTAIQNPQNFQPEYVWSYEAGLRSSFWDRRARLSLNAFHYDYTDLQVNKYDAVNLVTLENAASAKVNGVEGAIALRPVNAWNLSGSVSWLDATYSKFDSVDPDNGAAGLQDLAGNQLVRTPKFSANVSTDYTVPIDGSLNLTVRGSYYYRSRIYFTPFNALSVSQSGFGIANLSADLVPSGERWRVSAFVKNVGDTFYYQEIARSASIVGTIGWPGEPRTWGVEVGIKF